MSAKGTTWGNHKYIRIENGKYIYADSKSAKSSHDKKAASAMASLLANYKKNKGVKLGTGKTAKASSGKSGGSKEKEKKEKEPKEKEKKETEKKITYKSVDDIKKFYKQHYSILPKDPKDGGKKETIEDEEQKKKKPKLIKHADDCVPYISDGKYFTETSFVPYL